MILIDNKPTFKNKKRYYHLTATTLEELHSYCNSIGLKKCWFHSGTDKPHYDVPEKYQDIILNDEKVIKVTKKELVDFIKKNYDITRTN